MLGLEGRRTTGLMANKRILRLRHPDDDDQGPGFSVFVGRKKGAFFWRFIPTTIIRDSS
jgi:hypothetical protein